MSACEIVVFFKILKYNNAVTVDVVQAWRTNEMVCISIRQRGSKF